MPPLREAVFTGLAGPAGGRTSEGTVRPGGRQWGYLIPRPSSGRFAQKGPGSRLVNQPRTPADDPITRRISELVLDAHRDAVKSLLEQRPSVEPDQNVLKVLLLGLGGLVALVGLLSATWVAFFGGIVLLIIGAVIPTPQPEIVAVVPARPLSLAVGVIAFRMTSTDRGRAVWNVPEPLAPPVSLSWSELRDPGELVRQCRELRGLVEALPGFLTHGEHWRHIYKDPDAKLVSGGAVDLLDHEAALARAADGLTNLLADRDQCSITVSPLPRAQALLCQMLPDRLPAWCPGGNARETPAPLAGATITIPEGLRQDGELIDEALSACIAEIKHAISVLGAARHASCRLLSESTAGVVLATQPNSLSYLCPTCNQGFLAKIEQATFQFGERTTVPALQSTATLTRGELEEPWTCRLCGCETRQPLIVPRLLVECLLPAFSLLLEEHHQARQQIYADIDNQKRHYLNEAEKELFARRDSNRRDSSAIMIRMQETQNTAEAIEAKLAAFAGLVANWRILEEQRLAHLTRRTENIAGAIAESFTAFESRYKAANKAILGEAMSSINSRARLAQRETAAQMAHLQSIASATNRTASSTERTALATERTAVASEATAAVQMAWANKEGLLKPPAWNVLGRVSYEGAEVGRFLSGKSAAGAFLSRGGEP